MTLQVDSFFGVDFTNLLSCTKTQNYLHRRFDKLVFLVPLPCLGSMAQGSRAGSSAELGENSVQTSLYSSHCLLVQYILPS